MQLLGKPREPVARVRPGFGELFLILRIKQSDIRKLAFHTGFLPRDQCASPAQLLCADHARLQAGKQRVKRIGKFLLAANRGIFGKAFAGCRRDQRKQRGSSAFPNRLRGKPAVFACDTVGQALEVQYLAIHIAFIAEAFAKQRFTLDRLLFGHDKKAALSAFDRLPQIFHYNLGLAAAAGTDNTPKQYLHHPKSSSNLKRNL